MSEVTFLDSQLFAIVVLPLLIFLARITDVTLGTLRIIFVSRGLRLIAVCAGFVEVLIWLFAMTEIMANLTNYVNYFAYAGGFAAGTFIGITIESRIALGYLIVRIITQREATELEQKLREEDFIVTSLDAHGGRGPVKVLFLVVKRKLLPEIVETIKTYNPKAFYTVEDLRMVSSPGILPIEKRKPFRFIGIRKGK